MPITLLTGLPGHGKTALMMELLLEASQRGERPIFAAGIDGLAPGIASALDDPRQWNAKDEQGNYVVPNGALIFVDEVWKWFGHLHDATRQATPAHVLALAEHRHRGIDFVWTTQTPAQIYPFARGLIQDHWHVVRRFGTSVIEVFRWAELNDDIKSTAKREAALRSTRTLPEKVFGQYKSASDHTIKARVPWRVWSVPLAILAAVLLIVFAIRALRPENMTRTTEATSQDAAAAGGAAKDGASASAPFSPQEYAQRLRPRIAGLHGSQPIFDGRKAKAEPATYCMIAGQGNATTCHCYTEQVTPIADVREDVCRAVARHGFYDPFRAPFKQSDSVTTASADEHRRQDVRPATPLGVETDPASVGSPHGGEIWGKAF